MFITKRNEIVVVTLRRIFRLSKSSHLHSTAASAEPAPAPPRASLGFHLRAEDLAVWGEQLMQQCGVCLRVEIVHRQSDAPSGVRSIRRV